MSYREITKIWQYNEPVKRTELLSTHGVGSLKITTWGVVMPRIIEEWPLLTTVNDIINKIPAELDTDQRRADFVAGQFFGQQIQRVQDERLIRLLRLPADEGGKGYTSLHYLIGVPQVELNRFNQFKSSALRNSLPPSAVHFPKYLFDPSSDSRQRALRTYAEALAQFRKSLPGTASAREARDHFVPPRSARPVPAAGNDLPTQAAARDLLEPVPMVLMCAHGHLSDVPWARYLGARWRSRSQQDGPAGNPPNAFPDLFAAEPCCANPQLLWQSRGRTSDSFAGVRLSCANCPANTDLSALPRLHPHCPGHRPWVAANDQQGCDQQMQYALTTGTNLYFPLGYSGLYLPEKLLDSSPLANPENLIKLRAHFEVIAEDEPKLSPTDYWARYGAGRLAKLGLDGLEAQKLRAVFLGESLGAGLPGETATEHLKREEYELFTRTPAQTEPDFTFRDVPLTNLAATDPAPGTDGLVLAGRLAQARRVDELRLTRVQLAFTRVQALDPDRLDDEPSQRFHLQPQRIHKNPREEVAALPALTSTGEGIFLELDLTRVAAWENLPLVREACETLRPNRQNPVGSMQQHLVGRLSPRLLLVHTLAHLLMRELEWKCGYPAASLNERIYARPAQAATDGQPAQPGQAALLLYATEGSQGSMGGLTFQARPALLEQLVREALDRALDCPADPICWHADTQAGTPLVRAACFACAMTAETSCELQNSLLDRRLLIDPEYGFFSQWDSLTA